jgi:inner membrane protein
MDPLTHVATGVICSQLLPAPSRWWAVAAGVIFALLPDVDYFIIFWNRLAFIRFHRGFTHSLAALVLFALAGALVGRFLGGPRWFKPLLILGLVVLGSHLLLDLVTSYGTQLFSPFSGRRLSLDWVFIIDPYLTALLVLGAVGSLLLPRWGPRLGGALLAVSVVYVMVGAAYHHQALKLARQVFSTSSPRPTTVAALPQPLSCRRWHLIASGPGEIRQAFVQLPFEAALGWGVKGRVAATAAGSPSSGPTSLAQAYQAPDRLTVQTWIPSPPASAYSP